MVITGLTRNQFAGNRTWVRIPPSPPKMRRKCLNCQVRFRHFLLLFSSFEPADMDSAIFCWSSLFPVEKDADFAFARAWNRRKSPHTGFGFGGICRDENALVVAVPRSDSTVLSYCCKNGNAEFSKSRIGHNLWHGSTLSPLFSIGSTKYCLFRKALFETARSMPGHSIFVDCFRKDTCVFSANKRIVIFAAIRRNGNPSSSLAVNCLWKWKTILYLLPNDW